MKKKTKGVLPMSKGLVAEDYRPWGHYRLYAENESVTVKKVTILAKQALSLQYHNNRDQLYVILDRLFIQYSTEPVPEGYSVQETLHWLKSHQKQEVVHPGQELWFPRRTVHRPVNLDSAHCASFFEVAYGHNDEKDIVRLEDMYGREET